MSTALLMAGLSGLQSLLNSYQQKRQSGILQSSINKSINQIDSMKSRYEKESDALLNTVYGSQMGMIERASMNETDPLRRQAAKISGYSQAAPTMLQGYTDTKNNLLKTISELDSQKIQLGLQSGQVSSQSSDLISSLGNIFIEGTSGYLSSEATNEQNDMMKNLLKDDPLKQLSDLKELFSTLNIDNDSGTIDLFKEMFPDGFNDFSIDQLIKLFKSKKINATK